MVLALARERLRRARLAPRVVLLSATLDAQLLRAYFGCAAPIDVAGRRYALRRHCVEVRGSVRARQEHFFVFPGTTVRFKIRTLCGQLRRRSAVRVIFENTIDRPQSPSTCSKTQFEIEHNVSVAGRGLVGGRRAARRVDPTARPARARGVYLRSFPVRLDFVEEFERTRAVRGFLLQHSQSSKAPFHRVNHSKKPNGILRRRRTSRAARGPTHLGIDFLRAIISWCF